MAAPLNATFFTLSPRPRAALVPATVAAMAILALIIGAFVAINWGFFASMFELLQTQQEPSEEEAFRMMGGVFGVLGTALLLLIPAYILLASYEAACLRWMIRGETPGFFGLTLDADTWRVYGVYWAWFVGHMVVGMALSIVMMPVMMMSMGDLMSNPDPNAMLSFQLRTQIPLMLAQNVVLIFLGVRLSPAAATSVARRRFSFFEAWTVTSGRFWPLLGAWVVLWLIFAVIYTAVFAAAYGTVLLEIAPLVWQSATSPTMEGIEDLSEIFMSPRMIWSVAAGYGGGIIAAFLYALMSFGVNARTAMAALEEGKITEDPA